MLYALNKKSPSKYGFFRVLCALMKAHQISHAIFETKRSGFIQISHHCSVSWKIAPLCFFSSHLIYFEQKEPIEVKFWDFWVVGWKSPNLYLKPKVSFSLNFVSLFSVLRDNSCAKSQTFDCSHEISPNVYFDRVLLLKVYKTSAKKVQRSCLMTLKSDAKFEEKLIWCFKIDMMNFMNFDTSTWKIQKLALWLVPFVQSI